MNTNIAFLRGNVVAPAFQRSSRANGLKRNRLFETPRAIEPRRAPPCDMLTMSWRINPASGRPECRWSAEHGRATDEGVSCRLRQAA